MKNYVITDQAQGSHWAFIIFDPTANHAAAGSYIDRHGETYKDASNCTPFLSHQAALDKITANNWEAWAQIVPARFTEHIAFNGKQAFVSSTCAHDVDADKIDLVPVIVTDYRGLILGAHSWNCLNPQTGAVYRNLSGQSIKTK
jgi:hypothetical protein